MKRLLGWLGAIGLVTTSSAPVVSCWGEDNSLDLSKATIETSLGQTITLTRDVNNGHNFIGKISPQETSFKVKLHGLQTLGKDLTNQITINQAKTIVASSKIDLNINREIDFAINVNLYDKKIEGTPSIDAKLLQGNLKQGNIIIITFTFEGENESTITLNVEED